MQLFGLKIRREKRTEAIREEVMDADLSNIKIYTGPQAPWMTPKDQEVDCLATDDLLGEADVYWTYGKWHAAMQIYEWWVGSNGTGPAHEVARKYLDCAAKAMDFEAFYRMMRKLIDQNVDRGFLQDMAVFGLMRDPSNFDLIGIAETVEVEESRIISIAQKVVDAEQTPGQRKNDLWKRNRSDAGGLSDGVGALHGVGSAVAVSGDSLMLVTATASKDYESVVSSADANFFGALCGAGYLDDSAAVVDHWKIESVMEHLRREMESRPMNLTVYVDYLRITHGEGLREEYAATLLALFSVLLSANAGSGLRRRLLASGRLLGQYWIFDFLSGSQGREFMALARKVQASTSVYVPEKAWAKSSDWMQPLACEILRVAPPCKGKLPCHLSIA